MRKRKWSVLFECIGLILIMRCNQSFRKMSSDILFVIFLVLLFSSFLSVFFSCFYRYSVSVLADDVGFFYSFLCACACVCRLLCSSWWRCHKKNVHISFRIKQSQRTQFVDIFFTLLCVGSYNIFEIIVGSHFYALLLVYGWLRYTQHKYGSTRSSPPHMCA